MRLRSITLRPYTLLLLHYMWVALARWRHTSGVSEQHRLARLRLPAACLGIAQQVGVAAAEIE
eukprot:scaffold28748_cov64-Phaeocystis_antarctica.AAC.3